MTNSPLFNKSHYVIQRDSILFDALNLINSNKKGFVVVCEGEKVLGVLTDGDIRRLLLSGSDLNDKVLFKDRFEFINYNDGFEATSRKFREHNLKFILILKNGNLFNILHKNQFHIMLLEDVEFKTDLNYEAFDRNLIHEIYNRPWGFYKSVLLNSHAQAKILTIFTKSETSLQSHKYREEHWVVVKGQGRVVRQEEEITIKPGQYVHIPQGYLHQIINTSQSENLVISEVQLGEYFGEDDIIRFKDKYGRS